MTITEYPLESFAVKEYVASPQCRARILSDAKPITTTGAGIPPAYDLWVAGKWKRVNEGVFNAWLLAYEEGKAVEKKSGKRAEAATPYNRVEGDMATGEYGAECDPKRFGE